MIFQGIIYVDKRGAQTEEDIGEHYGGISDILYCTTETEGFGYMHIEIYQGI